MCNRVLVLVIVLIGCIGSVPVRACETGPGFCILDRSITDRLDADYTLTGTGDPLAMTKGMGAQPTDDGMIEVFPVDGKGCRVPGGAAFFMYPEIFAFEPTVRGSSLVGSATSGASYGSGGGGGKICK